MVILKEISEGIWGKRRDQRGARRAGLRLGLKLGLNSTADVVTDRPVRLTMAALEIDEGKRSLSLPAWTITGCPFVR